MNYLFKWLDDIDTKPESLPTRPKADTDGVVLTVDNQTDKSGDKVIVHCSAKVDTCSTNGRCGSNCSKHDRQTIPSGLTSCYLHIMLKSFSIKLFWMFIL
jgi:hypothetical protein